MRFVALYQRVFEHQGLKFRLDYDDVEVVHLRRHRRNLGQVVAAEIAGHAVFQRLRLADVYHLAARVLHDIHARQQRQAVRLVAQLIYFRVGHLLSLAVCFTVPSYDSTACRGVFFQGFIRKEDLLRSAAQ